jgi:hypothetical protein
LHEATIQVSAYALVLDLVIHASLLGRFILYDTMEKLDMTSIQHRKRKEYILIALGLNDIRIDNPEVADTLIHTFDAVNRLKGDFTIRDAAGIKAQVREHYKKLSVKKRKKKAS